MRLKDKIALITGSARGIEQATAELFHKGGRAEYIQLDVREEKSWSRVTEYLKNKFGRLDILVNNAGITGFLESTGPWDAENSDLESWEEVHRVNSTGVMLGCKYAIRLMKEKGGSIVNISSRSRVVGIPGSVAYASSKAAVRNHTKSVALYCTENGYKIRCNSVHPVASGLSLAKSEVTHFFEHSRS